MTWAVVFEDAFAVEFRKLDRSVQEAILTYASVLEQIGPQLGRPYADTLQGSRHPTATDR